MHPNGHFQLVSEFEPAGDQPQAIDQLSRGLGQGRDAQTLLGVTGSGKTFTMAHVIAASKKPTLVVSHNKTLAAQLYEEFRELFPHNAVSYFVSYYDYYQPEAYIPQRDIYIEKDSSRNDDLDRLRLSATTNLMRREDVIIVASVSSIFGLGSPAEYERKVISVHRGQELDRRDFLHALNDMQYARNDMDFKRGTYRVRGDVIEVHPAYEEFAYRIELFGDEVDSLELIDPLTGELLASEEKLFIYPAVHYVMPEDQLETALASIQSELDQRVMQLRHEGKLLEAQRLLARTKYDMEMMEEVGFCSGIENYSRHLDGRPPGSRPYTLLDYFPDDFLLMIDESHVTVPQLHAMYNGDQKRKQVLVDHGFRLPSAKDNRPLKFEEFEKMMPRTLFVSATPGPYELERSGGEVIEQVIRPTGLVDPPIEVRAARDQVNDIIQTLREIAEQGDEGGSNGDGEEGKGGGGGGRALVNTLTKRLAEDLSGYLAEQGLRCRYLHSDIDTIDRVQILRELRQGEYDVLVGVNLLREGLDLPEVSLVAILDADKTGFLRSETSMIQQMGRAARNASSTVLLYADEVTPAMDSAIHECERRRQKQLDFNKKHGITPKTIHKAIRDGIESELRARRTAREAVGRQTDQSTEHAYDPEELIAAIEKEMYQAAESLEFEKAAALRDRVDQLKNAPQMGQAQNGEAEPHESKPGEPGGKSGTTRRKKKKSVR